MKNKAIANFWKGFIVAAMLTAFALWLRRQQREIAPRPLVVRPRPAAPARSAARPPADAPDPLEVIEGIGPIYADRLRQAGIRTFAALAEAAVDDLRAITGSTRWDPAEWIAQARKLAA
jgi:predicted flap endonuclease-1-like 5' DNA nuclease